jgi:thymidylate synthase
MNKLDEQYKSLLQDIINTGVLKDTRNGKTRSVFGRQIRHKMSDGFPLLTTKKMAFKSIVTELLWFLRGETDIRYLWKHNCHIWDGDWYSHYSKSCSTPYSLEEMIQFGLEGDSSRTHFHKSIWNLGLIYGHQWRNWNDNIDQIANLINDLKNNPDSRRLMVNAWNVGELDQMVLPPCHYGFQVWTRELSQSERFNWYGNKIGSHMHHDRIEQEMDQWGVPKRAISLMWSQRSVDTFLGLPFNIASYGLLLEIIAKEVNMVPDELIGNLGDVHLYSNHIEQAEEQLNRTPFPLPTLRINKYRSDVDSILFDITKWSYVNFTIEDYQSHPTIKAPLSN